MRYKIPLENGIGETVTRPMLKDIAVDIAYMLGIADPYVMYGDDVLINRSNTGRDTSGKTLPDELLTIRTTEEPISGEETTFMSAKENFKELYQDDEVATKASIRYRAMLMKLNITYKSKSKSDIMTVKNRMMNMVADNSYFNRHNLSYSVVLPRTLLSLVTAVYLNKKAVYTDLSLVEYINSTFDTGRLDKVNPLSGNVNDADFIISETQKDILGYIAGDITNTDTDKEGSYNMLTFEYEVNIKKPMYVLTEYPLMVFNKLLPREFHPEVSSSEAKYRSKFSSSADSLIKLATKHESYGINQNGLYLTFPVFDTYTPSTDVVGYNPVMSILLEVEDEAKTELFNINDLPYLEFKDTVLDFLKAEGNNIGTQFSSLFYFALYREDRICSNKVSMDETGMLKLSEPLSKKHTYRLFIYMLGRTNMLSCGSLKRVKSFLNQEIELQRDRKRELSSFAVEDSKDSTRSNNRTGTGVETRSTETFIDVYFDFFKVPQEEIYGAIKRVNTKDPSDIVFKVEIPKYNWVAYSSSHYVDVSRLFKV